MIMTVTVIAADDPTLTTVGYPVGATATVEGVFVVENGISTDTVYTYTNATSTQYDIVANGTTLASGDCHPTSASAATEWACMYTVASGTNGDFTLAVGSDTGDIAGNSVGAYTHGTKLTLDNTAPTLVRAGFVAGGAVTVVMSEDVWAGTAPAATDFKVKSGTSGSETANVVTGITGLASTKAGADDSFALAVTTALASGDSVKVYYTKGANAVTDEAGNEVATIAEANAVSATDTTVAVSISAVSTDDYINDAEDENAVTISGTSAGLTTGTTVTVAVDGLGTDISGKTDTTDASGNWSVSLTSDEVKALDADTPDADGEDLTITATATGATSGTRTVAYDPTAPTVASGSTGYYASSSLGTALTGSVKTGTEIYTKVTFSEVVGETVANDSTARPVISYSLGGTDTQYDIIASGTPASGDCVESGSGASDGKQYTCRYTIASGNTGSFGVKVGTSTTDTAGNPLASTYTHSATLTADTTVPTVSYALYSGSTIVVMMSEDVWAGTAPAATDFKVKSGTAGSETANVVTGITGLASTKVSADDSFALAVTTTLASGDSVKVYYTKGANAVTDEAGNEVATIAEANAVSATEGSPIVVALTPSDEGYVTSLSGVMRISFSDAVYSDSACANVLTSGTAGNITALKRNTSAGAVVAHTVSYDDSGETNIITITPSSDLSQGDVLFVSLTDGWYYSSGGTCRQGVAESATVTVDAVSPAPTFTIATTGGVVSEANTFLNEGDTVSVVMDFSEEVVAAPIIQFKNNTVNLGGAMSSVPDTIAGVYSFSSASGDNGTVQDPYDFGVPGGTSGIVRETIGGNGYVYKTTRAFDSLYVHASGTVNLGMAFRMRYHTSAPTVSTIDTVGTELWTANSLQNTVMGGGRMTDVASGTYFWVYPSAVGNRVLSNRSMTIVSGTASGDAVSYDSGTLGGSDIASLTDPYNFGALTGVSGIEREALGSGYVYKTTKPFSVLSVSIQGQVQQQGTTTVKGRYHTSKPTTGTLDAVGTELLTAASTNQNVVLGVQGVMKEIPVGTYFWFYPDKSGWITQHNIQLAGTAVASASDSYTATYTVGSSDVVALGNLRYDVTNEASVTDAAGNAMAARALTTIDTIAIDTTVPTAALTGIPTDSSNATTLDVLVGGTEVTHYTYVVITGGGTGCTTATYSAAIPVATRITDTLTVADGTVTLCVKGGDTAGNYQTTATAATWTKDTTAPANSVGTPSGPSSVTTGQTLTLTGTTDSTAVLAGDYVAVTDEAKELARSSVFTADSDGAVPYTLSFSAHTLGTGTHTLTVSYYDAAGNSGGTASYEVVVTKKSSGGGSFAGLSNRYNTLTSFQVDGGEYGDQGTQGQQRGAGVPTRTYRLGDTSPLMLALQRSLNATERCKVAESGVGSAGRENQYFGALTAAAVRCYQREYMGLSGSAVTGELDAATAAHLFGVPSGYSYVAGSAQENEAGGTQLGAGVVQLGAGVPTRTYRLGDTSPLMLALQRSLNATERCKVAESGVGSAGRENQYFGALTAAAVRCYQREYMGLSGSAVTGELDAATAAHLFGVPSGYSYVAGSAQENEVGGTEQEESGSADQGLLDVLRARLSTLRARLLALLSGGSGENEGENAEEEAQQEQGQENETAGTRQGAGVPTRTYRLGDTSPLMLALQRSLNATERCKVAESGVGSAGRENQYFGALTAAAVRCYQREYMGLSGSAVTGELDAATAAHLFGVPSGYRHTGGSEQGQGNEADGAGAGENEEAQQQEEEEIEEREEEVEEAESQGDGGVARPADISTTYAVGDSDAVVRFAKVMLNKTSCRVAVSGTDSVGQETSTFTQYTAHALRCYQAANGLPVTGTLTPATWNALVAGDSGALSDAQGGQGQSQPFYNVNRKTDINRRNWVPPVF